MSKFKNALERGKKSRQEQGRKSREKKAERDAAAEDFKVRAKVWLRDIAVASLQAAKADVAGEMTIDIDAAALDADSITPSVRFQIYRTPTAGEKQMAPKTFTVAVQVDGGVSVSTPGMVAKDAGVIADKSAQRFATLLAELIEDAAKDTSPPTLLRTWLSGRRDVDRSICSR